ncbi:hypothetical protein FRC12_002541 [Ceratobasidium sp. 428]|nr:hypothetical protein FRC12_002541 [Ceratobasidium sp. 428]
MLSATIQSPQEKDKVVTANTVSADTRCFAALRAIRISTVSRITCLHVSIIKIRSGAWTGTSSCFTSSCPSGQVIIASDSEGDKG